jgi:hypothetical protein
MAARARAAVALLLLLAPAAALASSAPPTPTADAAADTADPVDADADSPAPRFFYPNSTAVAGETALLYPNSTYTNNTAIVAAMVLQQQRVRTRRARNRGNATATADTTTPFTNATLLPGKRTAILDAQGQFYFRNGTAVPREVSAAALRRASLLSSTAASEEALALRPTSPLDAAREATAMGVYGAAPVKLQYPGEPSFNGITGPLGSIDYDDGDGAECFRYLPGCLACDKFYTVAPGVGALFQYRCLACLTPEYVLNGIKCECGPGFGIPSTLGVSGGPKPARGGKFGYGGQATMYTSCQRCPGNFFLDPAFSSSGATLGPACIRCPRNTKAMPDQSGCGEFFAGFFFSSFSLFFFVDLARFLMFAALTQIHTRQHHQTPTKTTTECSPGAAPINRPGIQETTGLTLAPPRCVMCPAGTYVPSPNRGNYGCVPCQEGSTTPPGRFGMISTRANGNGKDACNCEFFFGGGG